MKNAPKLTIKVLQEFLAARPERNYLTRSCDNCPIAAFYGEHNVAAFIGNDGAMLLNGIMYHLPEFAVQFIDAVDRSPAERISGAEAMAILEELS
jgi:hypothetical protein